MTSDIVRNWFSDDFTKLSPELQELHLYGGILEGEVDIALGQGFAGFLGKRLSRN